MPEDLTIQIDPAVRTSQCIESQAADQEIPSITKRSSKCVRIIAQPQAL